MILFYRQIDPNLEILGPSAAAAPWEKEKKEPEFSYFCPLDGCWMFFENSQNLESHWQNFHKIADTSTLVGHFSSVSKFAGSPCPHCNRRLLFGTAELQRIHEQFCSKNRQIGREFASKNPNPPVGKNSKPKPNPAALRRRRFMVRTSNFAKNSEQKRPLVGKELVAVKIGTGSSTDFNYREPATKLSKVDGEFRSLDLDFGTPAVAEKSNLPEGQKAFEIFNATTLDGRMIPLIPQSNLSAIAAAFVKIEPVTEAKFFYANGQIKTESD